jgi:hypothetical protein
MWSLKKESEIPAIRAVFSAALALWLFLLLACRSADITKRAAAGSRP